MTTLENTWIRVGGSIGKTRSYSVELTETRQHLQNCRWTPSHDHTAQRQLRDNQRLATARVRVGMVDDQIPNSAADDVAAYCGLQVGHIVEVAADPDICRYMSAFANIRSVASKMRIVEFRLISRPVFCDIVPHHVVELAIVCEELAGPGSSCPECGLPYEAGWGSNGCERCGFGGATDEATQNKE